MESTSFDEDELSNDESVEESLTEEEASTLIENLWQKFKDEQYEIRKIELEKKMLTVGDKTIRWNECSYDETNKHEGQSLWISMHGGGNCPSSDNDEQYQNQICLYQPTEGIWIVPRSPTDDWNQWHQDHIDAMFNRIIENYVLVKNIDPNRVYLLGYSAGGDGVYQLAPRMADRFAAAAMMAGHPNKSTPLGLRNLPFAIYIGENDSAFNRVEMARQWAKQLDELEQTDPGSYRHHVNICDDMGHWMCGKDAEALPWMGQWTRNPWVKKVVWVQGDVIHDRFYWLSIDDKTNAECGQMIIAEIDDQTIKIETSDNVEQLTIFLSDALLNLDEPVHVFVEGYGEIFSGQVLRTQEAIEKALEQRADPSCVPTAAIHLCWTDG